MTTPAPCQGMALVMPQVPANKCGFTGRGKKPRGCHPESPLGVRDLHLHWHLHSPWHCHLPLHLPFLLSEISNLKFEISDAFVSGFAHCLIFFAVSLAAGGLFSEHHTTANHVTRVQAPRGWSRDPISYGCEKSVGFASSASCWYSCASRSELKMSSRRVSCPLSF
jgi:hypothetical protein